MNTPSDSRRRRSVLFSAAMAFVLLASRASWASWPAAGSPRTDVVAVALSSPAEVLSARWLAGRATIASQLVALATLGLWWLRPGCQLGRASLGLFGLALAGVGVAGIACAAHGSKLALYAGASMAFLLAASLLADPGHGTGDRQVPPAEARGEAPSAAA